MALHRFNPPPSWPVPTGGWVPPPDWRPDPSWPPAPADWQFWVRVPDPAAVAVPATIAETPHGQTGQVMPHLDHGNFDVADWRGSNQRVWYPTHFKRPPSPREWTFLAPPGWRVPTSEQVLDPSWPAPPLGWVFWRERWHGWLFLGSLIVGSYGVAIIASRSALGVLLGLLMLTAVGAAGWVSKGWRSEKFLPTPQRVLVWAVAVPGISAAICFLWMFLLHTYTARKKSQ